MIFKTASLAALREEKEWTAVPGVVNHMDPGGWRGREEPLSHVTGIGNVMSA